MDCWNWHDKKVAVLQVFDNVNCVFVLFGFEYSAPDYICWMVVQQRTRNRLTQTYHLDFVEQAYVCHWERMIGIEERLLFQLEERWPVWKDVWLRQNLRPLQGLDVSYQLSFDCCCRPEKQMVVESARLEFSQSEILELDLPDKKILMSEGDHGPIGLASQHQVLTWGWWSAGRPNCTGTHGRVGLLVRILCLPSTLKPKKVDEIDKVEIKASETKCRSWL